MNRPTIAPQLGRPGAALVAALCLAALLALPAANALAQDATPVSGNPYDPASCTTALVSTDRVAALLATPVAQTQLPVTEHGIVALPAGSAPNEDQLAAIETTLQQLWSCNNARNKAAVFSLFTDQAIQETVGTTDGSSWDAAELRADVAAALTPGEPRLPEEWATIDSIVSVTAYDDGQVGVLVLNTDPLVANGDQVLDYFKFVIVDGVANVSQIILDPYDLTDGYGFEKDA